MTAAGIVVQKLGELRLDKPLQKDRPPFIAAASGLVRHGGYCSVIGDDEHHLGVFSAHDLRPEQILRLLPGDLPTAPKKRKKLKPDFEVLTLLPPAEKYPHGALLVMGSGSKPNRNLGLLLALTAQNIPHAAQTLTIDFSALYAELQREFGVVNIEGATVQSTHLVLTQRGNKGDGENAVIRLQLDELLPELWRGDATAKTLRDIRHHQIGVIDNVPLGFSDVTCLPDGRLLALAVAEDTDDAYLDGATLGSCLCEFNADNDLARVTRLNIAEKVEGIAVWSAEQKTLAFVTDADDPEKPAALYLSTRQTRQESIF